MNKTYVRPRSWFRLFIYIALFILLSLHAPYCYLFMRADLAVLPDGSIDYDMGGIFPFTAIMIQALFSQAFVTVVIFILTRLSRYKSTASSAMTVAFLSILGLQTLIYSSIYFDRATKPQIIQAYSIYKISWLFLFLFSLYSVFRIIGMRREEKEDAELLASVNDEVEAELENSCDQQD